MPRRWWEWGDRWRPRPAGPATVLVHSCGEESRPELVCDKCREPVRPRDLRLRPGRGREEDAEHPLVRARARARA